MNQTARRVQTRQRERDAIRYRLAGATYADIANRLGVSEVGAYKIVKRVLEREAKTTAEESHEIRSVEVKRLDALLVIAWKKAAQGDLGAVDRILRIMERRSRFLGLDAPEKTVHSGGLTIELLDSILDQAKAAKGQRDAGRS
jgi:transposase